MAAQKATQRSLLVDLLIVLFGVSSWVAVNGLWVELPILVKELPESWKLSSYIVITTQIANLGPIIYSAARRKWSQKVLEVPIIHASLAVVVISCVILSFFWDVTTYIFGEMHGTALLILTFVMSCVDCTSSLLYLPFIANFKEQYVISYMMGAGLSGPIPGVLAIAQGVGGYAECLNKTVVNVTEYGNETSYVLEPYYAPPRFSVNIFFIALALQMVISWIAFILLNTLPQAKRERVPVLPARSSLTRPSHPALDEKFQSSVEETDFSSSIEKPASSEQSLLGKPHLTSKQFLTLLFIQGFVCTLHNGILLSVQIQMRASCNYLNPSQMHIGRKLNISPKTFIFGGSFVICILILGTGGGSHSETYSCLPYGSLPYHLTVTLSSFANPICCFIAVFLPITSVNAVVSFTVFCTLWGAYILMLALTSPSPPLVGTAIGSFLMVLAWVLVSGITAFIKACIASILRRHGGQLALFRCGVVTQIGSAIGAVITFSLIQFTTLFVSYSPCS